MGLGAVGRMAAGDIRNSLASLTGVNRLDASAIQNLTGGTPVSIRDALQTLTGVNRLDASAIQNLTGGTPVSIRDALQTLTGVNRLDASAIGNLPTGALPAWQTKMGNYSAVAGDRLRFSIAAVATLLLPGNPAAGDEVWFQRLETTANNLIIDSQGVPINGLTGKDGLFSPSSIAVLEVLVFVDGVVGWLGQFDRLTYQNHVNNSSVNLSFVSNGDANGLFHWLGTNLGTTSWSNPANASLLSAVASTEDNGTILSLSDRVGSGFYTANVSNQWVAWDLGATHGVGVSAYTLRSRSTDNQHLLRNWVLEGANAVSIFTVAGLNAATWTAIDTRSNDATLTTTNQYYTLTPNGSIVPYRYFRLRQTGVNSNTSNYLTLGEFEVYGTYF